METLVYLAIWAGLIYLMMRPGCGTHKPARPPGDGQSRRPDDAGAPQLRWVPPQKDTDPVCGQTVTTEKAKPSVFAGNVYYFCSRECREIFEAAPEQYVGGGDHRPAKLEHSHA